MNIDLARLQRCFTRTNGYVHFCIIARYPYLLVVNGGLPIPTNSEIRFGQALHYQLEKALSYYRLDADTSERLLDSFFVTLGWDGNDESLRDFWATLRGVNRKSVLKKLVLHATHFDS